MHGFLTVDIVSKWHLQNNTIFIFFFINYKFPISEKYYVSVLLLTGTNIITNNHMMMQPACRNNQSFMIFVDGIQTFLPAY